MAQDFVRGKSSFDAGWRVKNHLSVLGLSNIDGRCFQAGRRIARVARGFPNQGRTGAATLILRWVLLHRYGLGQVARLVNVTSTPNRNVISQQLQWNNLKDW